MSRHTRKVTYETTLTGKDLQDFAKDVPLDAAIHFEEQASTDLSFSNRDAKRVVIHATWEGQQ